MTAVPAGVPSRLRTTVLALVVPFVLLALATAWVVALLPDLPDPAATHWGVDGRPDGFGSPTSTIGVLVAMVVPFTVGMWAIGFFLGSPAATRRPTLAHPAAGAGFGRAAAAACRRACDLAADG